MKRIPLLIALAFAWPAFGVDLPTALRAAQAVDPQLASAAANRDAAAENEAIAYSRLLPQVNLQGAAQHLNQTTSRFGRSAPFSGPSNNLTVSLRQAIYRPREWSGWEIGKLQAEYGAVRLAVAASDLAFRTSAAWVDVLAAKAQRDVYAGAIEAISVAAAQEKKRLALGDGTRDSAAEAAAQLAQARAQLREAELDLEARLAAFRLLTRLDGTAFKQFGLPELAALRLNLGPESEALARVLELNPDLASARVTELVAQRRVAQAAADHKPTLDLVTSYNRSLNSTSNLGEQYTNTLIGVQLAIPIYAGGGLDAAQRQAAATYAAATADRETAAQKITSQFTSDWKAQEGLMARAMGAREMVLSALESRRAAQLGVKGGIRTWADVSQAEMQLARRQSEELAIIAALVKTQARLLSLLPLSEPAWDQWAAGISARSSNL